jgi:hypothetical protein
VRLEAPPLWATFLLAATVAWGGIALAVVTGSRETPALAQLSKPVKPAGFDERWEDALSEEPLLKQDRLPVMAQGPLPRSERALPPPAKMPSLVPTEEVKVEKKKKSMREGICAKGKRWFKQGSRKVWRCRR